VIFADRIRSVGKQARDESGKYPVNEEDEEIGTPREYGNRDCAEQMSRDAGRNCPRHSEQATQSIAQHNG
jgi:hypothetical protein